MATMPFQAMREKSSPTMPTSRYMFSFCSGE